MSDVNKIFILPLSKVDVNECLGLIIMIMNLFPGSWGTLLSSLADKKGFNSTALLTWLLQFLCTFLFIGWIWGILHGYAIYRISLGKR